MRFRLGSNICVTKANSSSFLNVGMTSIDNYPPVLKIEAFEETSFSELFPEPEEQSLITEFRVLGGRMKPPLQRRARAPGSGILAHN